MEFRKPYVHIFRFTDLRKNIADRIAESLGAKQATAETIANDIVAVGDGWGCFVSVYIAQSGEWTDGRSTYTLSHGRLVRRIGSVSMEISV